MHKIVLKNGTAIEADFVESLVEDGVIYFQNDDGYYVAAVNLSEFSYYLSPDCPDDLEQESN